MKNSNYLGRHKARCRAFTLIELLVVLGVIAVLGALLLPALAGAKAQNYRAQCALNLKQLGVGFRSFEQDHGEMFPPAAYHSVRSAPNGGGQQLAWDSYIHRYIGGTAPENALTKGYLEVSVARTPGMLTCPTDLNNPKVFWIGNPPFLGIKSYEMVGAGPQWATQIQVDPQRGNYPLPVSSLGVGMYWSEGSAPPGVVGPDWNAKSYKTSVVQDPGGTLLLVEEPGGQAAAGNEFPSVSLGPDGSMNPSWQLLYQIFGTAPFDTQNPSSSQGINQGMPTYAIHGFKFNYLFHDNHVEALSTNQTLGTGTLYNPKGMWTIAAGD